MLGRISTKIQIWLDDFIDGDFLLIITSRVTPRTSEQLPRSGFIDLFYFGFWCFLLNASGHAI